MASPGQVLENPAIKERIVFRCTTAETGGEVEVHARFELRPALRTEEMRDAFVGFARAGKVDAKGTPHPLELALIAREFEAEGYATKPPRAVQRALLAPVAALARLLSRRIS